LLGLFFDPEDGGDVSPKRKLTFNGLHGVISQKIELFRKFLAFQSHLLLLVPSLLSEFELLKM
jgi:hypothetical protein